MNVDTGKIGVEACKELKKKEYWNRSSYIGPEEEKILADHARDGTDGRRNRSSIVLSPMWAINGIFSALQWSISSLKLYVGFLGDPKRGLCFWMQASSITYRHGVT
jgi:hypothetical protein